ncbi:hypothetical protein C6988_09760 [Nitrosopumilus sp. b1]|uniref:hypothetical protein n=1 Tax=Nitrosopumilus sp. b1 TaxID=2109907 RepID=UPI0015F6033C|nr:hypothetical protein [Nitrosopumilus sp. b1]KAF6242192.1 hypothetical protein C6988_09760 [Nitrosopumilus sp. b1]
MVESVWDTEKSTSKQKIVKYLGKIEKAKLLDIPEKFRNLNNIIKYFSEKKYYENDNQNKIIMTFRENLENSLMAGNISGAENLFESYSKIYDAKKFIGDILLPVKTRIDLLLRKNQISNGTHTVCYNGMLKIIQGIIDSVNLKPKKDKVLVCSPYGQQSILENKLVEIQFAWKGHRVVNAPSFSSISDILFTIERDHPGIVFVTITGRNDISNAKRLIEQINEKDNIQIFSGTHSTKKTIVQRNKENLEEILIQSLSN